MANTISSMVKKNPKLVPLAAVLAVVVVVGGALLLRDQLSSLKSSANCYGYSCEPKVILSARAANSKDLRPTRGTITVPRGSQVELSWDAMDVAGCEAAWTSYTGLNLPFTLIAEPITSRRTFTVTCKTGSRNKKVQSSMVVNVQ